jgi:GMP synthase-like glutamine amidotransferase
MKRIGLLLVGHIDAGSLHIGGDYPELYADLLQPHDIELTTYRCDEGQMPESLSEQDGYICSPSRLSVYDNHQWLRDVEQLLRDMVAAETPYVGICFGHQLMAQALGATVQKAEVGWGIGAKHYEVVEAQPWMDSTNDIILAASHQDQVMQLPDGARLMARAPYCPVGGMLIGERAWTLQVHPEFSPALADSLLATRLALFGEDAAEAARVTLKEPLQQNRIAGWMSRFFHQVA